MRSRSSGNGGSGKQGRQVGGGAWLPSLCACLMAFCLPASQPASLPACVPVYRCFPMCAVCSVGRKAGKSAGRELGTLVSEQIRN